MKAISTTLILCVLSLSVSAQTRSGSPVRKSTGTSTASYSKPKPSSAPKTVAPAPPVEPAFYELDKVKQKPYLNEAPMKALADVVLAAYAAAIQSPQEHSTAMAAEETVYAFYDINSDGRLDKLNARQGKRFTVEDTADLAKDDRLMFSLLFDANGTLQMPDKLNVIAHREEQQGRSIKEVGLLAFQLPLTQEQKTQLEAVKLKVTAKVDMNSMTGDLKPVPVLLPFTLTRDKPTTHLIEGTITKNMGRTYLSLNSFNSMQSQIDELLKNEPLLLKATYQDFAFTVAYNTSGYNIDVRELRDNFIVRSNSQAKSFNTNTLTVSKFAPVTKPRR